MGRWQLSRNRDQCTYMYRQDDCRCQRSHRHLAWGMRDVCEGGFGVGEREQLDDRISQGFHMYVYGEM